VAPTKRATNGGRVEKIRELDDSASERETIVITDRHHLLLTTFYRVFYVLIILLIEAPGGSKTRGPSGKTRI
jgi:hypothetical protein